MVSDAEILVCAPVDSPAFKGALARQQERIATKDRLTIMMPIIKVMDTNREGRQLVHNILVRKGYSYIKYPNGRLRPVAQAIMNKNMARLRNNENPADIIRDMQVQLLLL